jgi:hypothetical protein
MAAKKQKSYKALSSFLFGHRVVTANSEQPFTEAEAKTLIERGVIKEVQEKN